MKGKDIVSDSVRAFRGRELIDGIVKLGPEPEKIPYMYGVFDIRYHFF